MSKFRLGIALGFASGYYLGAQAGRDRYLQLNRGLRRLRDGDALGKVRALVDLGRERARTHDNGPLIDLGATRAYSSN